jgi:hypothetical protein
MKKKSILLLFFIVASYSFISSPVQAALPGRSEDDVHFAHEHEFCSIATDWDSGWVPPSFDEIQVRLRFHIGCSFYADLVGKGILTWPPAMDLFFEGKPNGGIYGMDIGLQFEGRLKIDISTPLIDINWEGPIPFLPTIDLGFFEEKKFDPFLLSGNPERPVLLEGRIPRFQLLELGLNDFIGIPDEILDLSLSIEMDATFNSYFGGMRIDTSDHNRSIYEEGQRLRVNPPGEPQYEVDATYYGMVSHQAILFLYLTARIELLSGICGSWCSWDFDIFTLPIPMPDYTETWQFNTENLVFYLPDIEVTDMDYHPLTEIRFPPTQVGHPRTLHFKVVNMGYEDLEGTLKTSEPFLVRPEEFSLAPGDEAEINILFQPEGAGDLYGVVRIESNDPDEGDIDIPIFATGTFNEPSDIPEDESSQGDNPYWYDYEQTGCGCDIIAQDGPPALLLLLMLGCCLAGLLAVRRRIR